MTSKLDFCNLLVYNVTHAPPISLLCFVSNKMFLEEKLKGSHIFTFY